MASKARPNWREWWQKAAEDELSIQAILKENGAPSTACFLAQQMAEKYLKGCWFSTDSRSVKFMICLN